MLPAYHQFVNDFADPANNLSVFEGYSFKIDSATWRAVKEKAEMIIAADDTVSERKKFVDGSSYALIYNLRSRSGDTNDERLYENFYSFLNESFLKNIKSARKPRYWKK